MKHPNQNRTTQTARSTSSLAIVFCLMMTGICLAQQGDPFPRAEQEEFQLTGHFQLEENTRTGYLVLTAKIPSGSHIYSLTQKKNPPPSKIEIATSEDFQVSGTFKPEFQPTIENDPAFGGQVEKHKKSLRFFIPLKISPSKSPDELTIRLRFNGQICSDQGTCMPIRDKIIEAKFSGYFQRVAERTEGSGTVRR